MGFSRDYEEGLDDIDPIELEGAEAVKAKIKAEVKKFNTYSSEVMDVLYLNELNVELYINENLITEGDDIHVYYRVLQINREKGLQWFES